MTQVQSPQRAQALVGDPSGATSWDIARERLANHPQTGHHSWMATVRPDGRPHLMPVLTFWFDGALHFVVGEGTRKGRNLAANSYCVIGTESNKLDDAELKWAALWNPLPKVVFSTTLSEVQGNARLASGDVAAEIERLRAEPGRAKSRSAARRSPRRRPPQA